MLVQTWLQEAVQECDAKSSRRLSVGTLEPNLPRRRTSPDKLVAGPKAAETASKGGLAAVSVVHPLE